MPEQRGAWVHDTSLACNLSAGQFSALHPALWPQRCGKLDLGAGKGVHGLLLTLSFGVSHQWLCKEINHVGHVGTRDICSDSFRRSQAIRGAISTLNAKVWDGEMASP